MHTTGLGQRRRFIGNWWLPAMVVCILGFSRSGWSQAGLPALSASQVVQHLMEKNKERAQALQHYTGRRTYRLEYRGFPAAADATMEVEVSFEAPGAKHFTILKSSGSKLIQGRVFHKLLESEQQAGDSSNRSHSELSPENYTFTLAGTEGMNYVLSVEPKQESKFLYRGRIWIDGHDFAVTRIEAQPARNPSFWTTKSAIHHTYQKVENGFYLPKENKTVTSVRLGGVATLTIEYQSYEVTVSSTRRSSSSATVLWPDSGFNQEVANFAASRK